MAKIYFSRGTAENYKKAVISTDTLYFLEDTHEIYLGNDRIGFGQDILIEFTGTGNLITNVVWDEPNKILTLVRGKVPIQDIRSVIDPLLEIFHENLKSEFVSKTDIDDKLSEISKNPVQNKVLYKAIKDAETSSKNIQHDTTEGWNSQPDLIGEDGVIYIYNDYKVIDGQNIAGIKIGDGKAYLIDIPFIDEFMYEHIQDVDIHVSEADRRIWNNKLNVDDNEEVTDEALVFNRN